MTAASRIRVMVCEDQPQVLKTQLKSLDPPLGALPGHVLTSSGALTLEPAELVTGP